jgi:hypothetical protein
VLAAVAWIAPVREADAMSRARCPDELFIFMMVGWIGISIEGAGYSIQE